MTMQRDEVRRYTTWAKGAAIVLLAAAGAAIAIPSSMLTGWSAAAPSQPAAQPGTNGTGGAPEQPRAAHGDDGLVVDRVRLVSQLWEVGPEFKPPTPRTQPEPEEPRVVAEDIRPTPTVATGVLRYLGSIQGPRRVHALMALDGQQRLARVGDVIGEEEIIAIKPDAVRVRRAGGGAERELTLAEATVSWATQGPAASSMGMGQGMNNGSGRLPRLPGSGRGTNPTALQQMPSRPSPIVAELQAKMEGASEEDRFFIQEEMRRVFAEEERIRKESMGSGLSPEESEAMVREWRMSQGFDPDAPAYDPSAAEPYRRPEDGSSEEMR